MKIIKNIVLIIIGSIAGWLASYKFGEIYIYFVPGSGGSFLDGTSLIGTPLGYVFLNTLLMTAFGSGKKYLWLFFVLIPAFAFFLLDFIHIYVPIVAMIAALLIGIVINKLIKKLQTPDIQTKV